ncbi:MAG: FliM/FliN family flagellar motor switch protein, partial [Candidatus Latescibacterota bacterium]|nr:FliM/FliN family flagellar motor switch protein [Candidatus Latescibacterota bacterium]
RMVIDVDLAFCSQLVYSEFIVSLANPSSSYSFSMKPFAGQALMSLGNELVMAIIDRNMGGQGQVFSADARAPTQIEMNVINKLATRILTDLEATWEPVARIEITEVALETSPEFSQITAPSDGVFVVAFEANARTASGLVHLCYPLSSLDPLLPRLTPSYRDPDRERRRPTDVQTLALSNTKIPVHIEIARGNLALNDVADLQVGDIVKLDTPTHAPAVVFIGNRPKFFGRPGLRGKKRAVQLTQEIAPGSEELYE